MAETDLAKLIEDMSNSLHAELQEVANRIETAVERHSKQITSGTFAIGALNRSMTKHDRMIRDLQTRVRKLEQRKK